MSLPGSASPASADRRRDYYAHRSGEAVVNMLRLGITARDILTKPAFENAIAVAMALGGSTNVILHLLAIAYEAEVDLTIDDFNRIGDTIPHLADMKPFGKYVMNDMDRHGGLPVLMKALLDAGLLHGDVLTVTGKTLAENLAELDIPDARRQGAAHARQPHPRHRRPHGAKGSLAPEGAVVKTAGFDAAVFEGPAKVFERERAAMDALTEGRDRPRRRRRDPLRRPQGRPRNARDARHHGGDQGRWPRQRCTTLDRRQILRRHNRTVYRPHSTRSGGRRSYRLRARW